MHQIMVFIRFPPRFKGAHSVFQKQWNCNLFQALLRFYSNTNLLDETKIRIGEREILTSFEYMKFPNARVTLVSGLGLGGGCMACCTSCSPGGSSDLNNGYPSSQSGTFTNFTMSSVLICWHAYFQSSYCRIVASVRALSAAFTMMLWLQIKKKQWFCCPSESKCSKYVEEQYTDSTIDKMQACRGRSINVNTIDKHENFLQSTTDACLPSLAKCHQIMIKLQKRSWNHNL